MTDKIMSFDEWFKQEPNLETREKQAAKIAWDACNEMHEYQCNEEIDSLKYQLKEKDEIIKTMSKIIEDAFGCEYCKKVPCANIETRRCSGFEFQVKE